jgi:hypothetical protein
MVLYREEREKYYKHRNKAKQKPNEIVCMIIDGMDQMKLMIPKLINVMKAYSSAWRLKTHLTGVLNHGREAIGYFDLHQWPHDSNLTINILLRALLRMDNIPVSANGQLLAREQEPICNCFSCYFGSFGHFQECKKHIYIYMQ